MKRLFSGIMLALLLTSMLTLAFNIQPVRSEPKTWIVDDDGPADFHKIQEAFNAASEGDTIIVQNGTYHEDVSVNKTILLIAEAIVDGNIMIENGATLRLENSSLHFMQLRGAWNQKITIQDGRLECSGSLISSDYISRIYGGEVFVENSTLDKINLRCVSELNISSSVLSYGIRDPLRLELYDSKVAVATFQQYRLGCVGATIVRSNITYLSCVGGGANGPISIQESNIDECDLIVSGGDDFNVTNLSPGFIESWNSIQSGNFSSAGPSSLANVTISNSNIYGWSFVFGNDALHASIYDSVVHSVDVGNTCSCISYNSRINEIWLEFDTYCAYNLTITDLIPGFFNYWNSFETTSIEAGSCSWANISAVQTCVDSWAISLAGGEGSLPQPWVSNFSLSNSVISYLYWNQGLDDIQIRNSTVSEFQAETIYSPLRNETICDSSFGDLYVGNDVSILVSNTSINNLITWKSSTAYLLNCTVNEARSYENSAIFVIDSPHTVKRMFIYDSSHVSLISSIVDNLRDLGPKTVEYFEQAFGQTEKFERDSIGTPTLNLVGASNLTTVFTFQALDENGCPIIGDMLQLTKSDGAYLQQVTTNMTGFAAFDVTWGYATNTTEEDFFVVTLIEENQTKNLFLNSSRSQVFSPISSNIKISNVSLSATVVGQGYNMSIGIMTFGYGNCTENINITIYGNTTIIGEINNIDMANKNFAIVQCTWDTSGFAKGNYTISAVADTVPGETYTEDNTFIDGIVIVTLPGDTNGDAYVNAEDAVLLGSAFNSKRGDTLYSPNSDINGDQWCNAKDAVILGVHFNEHWE